MGVDTGVVLGREYRPRFVDKQVEEALAAHGAVVLEGPRGCGKTMTGVAHAASAVFMDDPATVTLADIDADYPLIGERPRLIDEWQLRPEVWNQARRQVDRAEGFGNYILTGSAIPSDDITRHSGAARFLRIRQRTLTWAEKGKSQPRVALNELFSGADVPTDPTQFSLDDNLEALLTSGFPAHISLSPEQSRGPLRAYLSETARTDVYRLHDFRHDPIVLDQLLASLARVTASEVTHTTIRKDLKAVAPSISVESVAMLVDTLERIFVLESVPAWAPRLRSKARLRTSRKYHLADASLAAAALGATAESLRRDPETLGFLFESAVVHDLSVMAEALGGRVYHYRDSNGYEIDAVIVLDDARWGAVEVKLGYGQVDEGVRRLRKALDQIDAGTPPSFAAVITATGMSYTTEDKICTFPFLALGL